MEDDTRGVGPEESTKVQSQYNKAPITDHSGSQDKTKRFPILASFLMLPFAPEKSLKLLLNLASPKGAVLIAFATVAVGWVVDSALTDSGAKLLSLAQLFAATMIQISLISATVVGLSRFFYGRGSLSSTFTLIGFCTPWPFLLLWIFASSLYLAFNSSETVSSYALSGFIPFLVLAAMGFWMLYVFGVAVKVANALPREASILLLLTGLGVSVAVLWLADLLLTLLGFQADSGTNPWFG